METPRNHKLACSLGVLLLLTYAYFYQGASWGTAVRYDLVRALAEKGTVCIDAFHQNTGDKAVWKGHYYCDKAPGGPLVAVPAQWVLAKVLIACGVSPESYLFMQLSSYVMVLVAVAAPSAIAATFLFLLLRQFGHGELVALMGTLGWSVGSIAFPYSTAFYGHQTAAAALVIAFWSASRTRACEAWGGRAFVTGLFAGGAAVTEFPCTPVLLALAAYCAVRSGRRQLAPYALGAAVPVIILLLFNWVSFDSPLRLGYSTVQGPGFRRAMSEGFLGITWPRPYRLLQLTFGGYRGLFVFCPVLFLALPGYVLWWRKREHRAELALCIGIPLYYLLLISSYYLWAGGWALGPRHLIPALPFLVPAIAFAVREWRVVGGILLVVSAIVMLAGTAVGPDVPNSVADPLFEYALPRFASGQMSINQQSFDDYDPSGMVHPACRPWNAFNLGERIGLHGLWSLLPLGLLWAAACAAYCRNRRMDARRPHP